MGVLYRHMLVLFTSPRLTWRTGILRAMTLSRITHCAPASAGFVLERTWTGSRVWPLYGYVTRYPTRLWAIDVGPEAVCFPEITGAYPAFRVFGAFLTRGLLPCPDDCVGITKRLLVEAGVIVPRSIVTPASLFRFLSARYSVIDLG